MGHNGLFEHVQRDELRASLEFLALVFVLLLLPNAELDVLFGLNPQRVWLVVVFIAGLNFFGYLLSKVVDPATAIGVTGVVGGCVSPGLTIISLTEQARRYPEFSLVYALAAASAVTMLFPRNPIVVGIVSPSLALSVVIPFVAMASVGVTVTGLLWIRIQTRELPASELDTPFRLRSAFAFGVIVTVIMVVINTFELSIPSDVTRIGIVLITVAEMSVYVGITWSAGERKMAKVLAVILLGSASVGITLVFLT
jgi:uncharacterized membrane protein (DUF4010 family)